MSPPVYFFDSSGLVKQYIDELGSFRRSEYLRERDMKKLKQYFLWLTIVVILMGMTACGPRETELSFETIERSDYSDYSTLESHVVLVTSQDDVDRMAGLINQTALDQLAELDFRQYFAIAVFRGLQASSGYDVIIEHLVRRNDAITVYAQFWEPSPYWEVLDIETSPYHLVKVYKDGDVVSQEIELVLQSPVVTPTPPSR